ncbi:hypothetical protein [Pseudomonas sp.]|uniref:hypothetical protein n=1 Tax=Pseudomonas sp. TaxID=306 RepID=UPI00289FD218|nr:hypothetical protein [Pseudomonas sp.]
MKWHFIDQPEQTIQYYVLHAMEDGCCQGCHVRANLRRKGKEFSIEQIRAAMQRMQKAGIIKRERGLWLLTEQAA